MPERRNRDKRQDKVVMMTTVTTLVTTRTLARMLFAGCRDDVFLEFNHVQNGLMETFLH